MIMTELSHCRLKNPFASGISKSLHQIFQCLNLGMKLVCTPIVDNILLFHNENRQKWYQNVRVLWQGEKWLFEVLEKSFLAAENP